jgi:hypothetical protein
MPRALSSKTIAEKFIRDQFAIMRKYGGEPKLSAAEYRALLTSTEKSFNALRTDEKAGTAALAATSDAGRGQSGNAPTKPRPALPRSKRRR